MPRSAFSTKPAPGLLPSMLLVGLTVALASAEVQGLKLHCDVSPRPQNRVRYQLRTEPGLDLPLDCTDTQWTDSDDIVLVQGPEVNQTLVQSLRNWTLELKLCLDQTQFSAHCPGFVKAVCRVNCSSLTQADPPSQDPSNQIAPTYRGPVARNRIFLLSVVAGVLLVLGFLLWKFLRSKCRRQEFKMVFAKEQDPPNMKLASNEVMMV